MDIDSASMERNFLRPRRAFAVRHYKIVKTAGILLLIVMFSLFAAAFLKAVSQSSDSKDAMVAEFRWDMNKLWEIAAIVESERLGSLRIKAYKYGATGESLDSHEINPKLKKALVKMADTDGDGIVPEEKLGAMKIMKLDEKLYRNKLRSCQYELTLDKNLGHYVVITEGKHGGTVLYNGDMEFYDSSKKHYFGTELYLNSR